MNQHLEIRSDNNTTSTKYGIGFCVSNDLQYDDSLRFIPNQIQPHSNAYLSNFRLDALGQNGQAER